MNEMEASPQSRNVHKERARRWGTNPWLAEWWANAVVYCQTPDGLRELTLWSLEKYGPNETRRYLRYCPGEPVKTTGAVDFQMFHAAAYELGVGFQALIFYNSFITARNVCQPPGILPAVRRRRGEGSWAWLSRRYRAISEGCKIPDIDWEECRRIAVSQYDAVLDLADDWRTDPNILTETLYPRAWSYILAPEVVREVKRLGEPGGSIFEFEMQLCDAFRYKLHILHMTHAHWSRAAKLFDDIADMGLSSPSAIERAYRKDEKLMWRLVSCMAMAQSLLGILAPVAVQAIAASSHFSRYVKRWRDKTGLSHIELKHDAPDFPPNSIDPIMIQICTNEVSLVAVFPVLSQVLEKYPNEAKKIDEFSYHVIGEYAVVQEFVSSMVDSAWGKSLREFALEADARPRTRNFTDEVLFMDVNTFSPEPIAPNLVGDAEALSNGMRTSWRGACHNIEPVQIGSPMFVRPNEFPLFSFVKLYNALWKDTDEFLWREAMKRDPPGRPGLVAETLGLYDPKDPDRPTFTGLVIERIEHLYDSPPEPPIEAFIPNFEVATPTEAVTSGRAILEANKDTLSQLKAKTRGVPGDVEVDALQEQLAALKTDSIEESLDIPTFLPKRFKLGRKIWKVFNRILECDTEDSDDAKPKKGQIRWGDFEKAMRKIGFDVVETAGSSVRFDPPAKTARPITFHRPHPDPLLTPQLISRIGSRLYRCYGWTTVTFEQASNNES